MRLTRRGALILGGGGILAAALPLSIRAQAPVEVAMTGRNNGAEVWFDPIGLHVEPGTTIRWVNREAGNVHTATAYHPDNGRALRIPAAATPWDSGYLLPDASFEVTLTEPGVYDYCCTPHEHAGMVGRIVVGTPGLGGWMDSADADGGVPAAALAAFPDVAAIIAAGAVRRP